MKFATIGDFEILLDISFEDVHGGIVGSDEGGVIDMSENDLDRLILEMAIEDCVIVFRAGEVEFVFKDCSEDIVPAASSLFKAIKSNVELENLAKFESRDDDMFRRSEIDVLVIIEFAVKVC